MARFVRFRRLRAILARAITVAALFISGGALADISVIAGSQESRDRILKLLAQRPGSESLRSLELTITVGNAALREQCAIESNRPIIAISLYQSHLAEAAKTCRREVVGIPTDAPWASQERLARALFPGARLATLIEAENNEPLVSREGVEEQLQVPGEGVSKSLGRLIREGRWDVFLLPIDHTVYASADYRLALETLVRHRKPAIASATPLLRGGAVAAVYFTPAQLDEALLASLDHFINTGQLVGQTPAKVQIEINKTVLRNLFGRIIAADELRTIQAGVNGG